VRRLATQLPLAALTAVLALFYGWTASNGKRFGLGQPHDGLYNRLADALVHGQLHLRAEPKPELFELTAPYEPGRNANVRLQDASLYRGRYYVYFGVAPALLLFVPWRLAGFGDLPESLAAVCFATVGFALWAVVLRRLVRAHFASTPAWARAVGYITVGLASVVPFALRGASVHAVAVTAGYACLAGATWCFVTAGADDHLCSARLAVGGLLLGLAVGCRPNHVIIAALLPLLAWPAARHAGARWRAALAVLLPLGACLLLLGSYNKARFGSWLEFGTRYQLAGARPVSWFDWRAVPPVAWFQFLAPPKATTDFPFFLPQTDYPGGTPEGFFREPSVTGALAHAPFLLILLAAVPLLRGARPPGSRDLGWLVLVLTVAGLVSPFLTAFVFASATMRYQVDFMPFLLVAALLLWLLALERGGAPRRAGLAALGSAAIVWSWGLAVALSLSGEFDALQRSNPGLWQALEQRAEPLRVALGRLLDRDGRLTVRLRVTFPERAAAQAEPLLSWGQVEAYDVLWVRQLAPNLFSFSLETSAGDRPSTPGLRFEAGRFYDFAIDLDRVRRRVRATVAGAGSFDLAARLVPLHENRKWPSRGPRGHDAPDLGCFSGTVIPEEMTVAGPPGLESLPPLVPLPALYTSGADAPAGAVTGQLWVSALKPGAAVFTGGGWRWIPRCFLDRLEARRRIAFAAAKPGTIEPILSWGDGRAFDSVFVRHVGGGRVAFGLAQSRGSWSFGARGQGDALAPGAAAHLVVIRLDRVADLVRVEVDGREVFSARADLAPIGEAWTRLGAGPRERPLQASGQRPATRGPARPLS
jgi:hypothetical protein